jgi:hypothetical protein
MGIFKSGAFLQQCFSVHPLTLNLKLVTPPDLVGVVCANCRMKHRLTIQRVVPQEMEGITIVEEGMLSFQHCSKNHPEDVRISLVDVGKNLVEFRCRPCRRTYLLEVSMIETHQS